MPRKHLETCFNYCSLDTGFFSSDEQRWINKVRKLKEQYPDLVTIIAQPETNDGCIYAKMPVSFLRLQGPSKKPNLSEEQMELAKQKLAEGRAMRLEQMRRSRDQEK